MRPNSPVKTHSGSFRGRALSSVNGGSQVPVWAEAGSLGVWRSACDIPQLQVPLAARPRNQLYLDHEVAGIWRPLAVSGRTQHTGQITLQRDLEALAIGLEQDCFDQSSDGLSRARPALFALQRQT